MNNFSSYGENSGFSAVNASELELVNGGKGDNYDPIMPYTDGPSDPKKPVECAYPSGGSSESGSSGK